MNLIFRSLQLDWKMAQLPMSLRRKLEFLAKKYLTLAKTHLFGYSSGKSHVSLFGEKFYYDDKFGISFLQSVFVDHCDLVKYIRPHGIVIDVGANIGQFNFLSRHILKASSVYSFEPVKETFDLLKMNAITKVFNLGIASEDKEQIFYIPETSLMASSCKGEDSFKEVRVACARLDEIQEIRALKNIRLVKIDTEGSELDVIKASIDIMRRSEYALIEASVNRPSTGNVVDLTNYIRENLPEFKLIWIGRQFNANDGTTLAVDCLFQNSEMSGQFAESDGVKQ